MRAIKFRAWDKKEKEMISHNRLFRLDTSNELPFLPLLEKFKDEYEVMEHTGLTDKNGKEIYEGDICFIQIYGNFGEPSDKESFNVQVKWEGNAFHLVDADGDTWTEWATYYKGEDVEIIGNIHENPELLEQPNAN